MRTKLLLFGAGLLLALVSPLGCSRGDSESGADGAQSDGGTPKRIVILTNGPDPFWDTCEAGARAAEKELGLAEQGYKVDFQRGDFTVAKQIQMLKQYVIDSDISAVGISVYNPDNLQLINEMRSLRDQGVHVLAIDSDVNRQRFRDARYAYLGTDNLIAGQELGKAAKAIRPDGANFAFFVGDTGVANAQDRMNGFIEGLGDAEAFKELERMNDGGDSNKARKNVEDVLNRHSECDMLVGIYAYNTPQIVNVVQDRSIRDETAVICFDAAEASISGMGEGMVDVMVVQNPYQMGFEGVSLMLALCEENEEAVKEMIPNHGYQGEQDIYRTELRVVVPDQDSPVTKDLLDPETEFFTHSEFKQWLAERGLISS